MTDLDRVLDDLPERRKDIASRLRELHDITSDDPDEPDLVLRAVASLVRFLRASDLCEPELAAGDGRILAQWDDPGIGLLALEFREDDHVEFALATGGESGEPIRVRRSGGPAPVAHCLDFVRRDEGGLSVRRRGRGHGSGRRPSNVLIRRRRHAPSEAHHR